MTFSQESPPDCAVPEPGVRRGRDPSTAPPGRDPLALGESQELFLWRATGGGDPYWLPRGLTLLRVIEGGLRAWLEAAGYAEIRTPPMVGGAFRAGTCAAHRLVHALARRAEDGPLRLFELGVCHRGGPGEGLLGGAAFTTDEAHVFCPADHCVAEVARIVTASAATLAAFGFPVIGVRWGTARAGEECPLAAGARRAGYQPVFAVGPAGEGAPTGGSWLVFEVDDGAGGSWPCGGITLEGDAIGGAGERPILLCHRLFGSLEAAVGLLLARGDGWLAPWLAPQQVLLAGAGAEEAIVRSIAGRFAEAGLRVGADLGAEALGVKLARARALGIPVVASLGPREAFSKTVTLSWPDDRKETLYIEAALARLSAFCAVPAPPGRNRAPAA
ncbi:anticodon-binding protein [Rhodospirillum rubrum]|nr:His/Gly/Thr/Pro-type tRNA ligase C-terminal domain-containing protein [Rhodospirillum rubrum]MBK1666198.1 anticodon-binding protein [Rhodospirillum rubrum]MBK1678334.1 anticodon-binding protein [Rhodospirillum rubrum]